jgi:hypothetical protein
MGANQPVQTLLTDRADQPFTGPRRTNVTRSNSNRPMSKTTNDDVAAWSQYRRPAAAAPVGIRPGPKRQPDVILRTTGPFSEL